MSVATKEFYDLNSSLINSDVSRDFSKVSLSSLSISSCTTQPEQFRSDNHAEHSLRCMLNYLREGKLCDVVLIAFEDNTKVQGHRLVLSAASEYFALMFTGSLKESTEQEIILKNIKGIDLQAVVNYCYTGVVEIREDNVESLLATACLMQLSHVVEACSRFLTLQLHPSNCLGIARFAEHQNCTSLVEEANNFIEENFMQIVCNQEFLQLSVDHVIKLLSNDNLNVKSEEHIFHALMAWINYDHTKRKPLISKLFSCLKLPLLSPAFLTDQVETCIDGDNACQQLIIEALKWHLLPERRLQLASNRSKPRKATLGKLLVVGGMDKNKGATTIESYDPRSDSWIISHNMNGRRLQFGIALLSDKLLIVGGRDGLKTMNTMECLDLKTGVWTQLTAMNTHRHGLGIAALEGTLYAVGGHDGWSYLNCVERWDSVSRSWSCVAPMQFQRCSAGVAVLNKKLYAIGGRDGSSCLQTVECYDPHINKWTLCASMSQRRGSVGVAVVNGYLYAIGGQDAPANNPKASRFDCVERYDPNTDSWTIVASISGQRDAVAACSLGDHLISVGGYDGTHYLRTVQQYDPIRNEWTNLAPLLTGRAGACIVTIGHSNENIPTE